MASRKSTYQPLDTTSAQANAAARDNIAVDRIDGSIHGTHADSLYKKAADGTYQPRPTPLVP